MEKIYKYAPADKAILILKNQRLLLKNPKEFNDPFDTNFKRNKEDIKEVRKLVEAYTCMTILVSTIEIPGVKEAIKKNPLYILAKKEYKTLILMLKKEPRFTTNVAFNALNKMLKMKSDFYREKAEEDLAKLEEIMAKAVKETKNNALVTCFSKDFDSILMWSHYADSHSGVCIEYDRPDNIEFLDVKYRKVKPTLKLKELVSYIIAQTILNEDYGVRTNPKLVEHTLQPFLTKSLQWKYEKEVRCLTVVNSNSMRYQKEGEHHYYLMPKPTRIFIGCRCKKEDRDKIIKIAKENDIKYSFIECDKDTFSLKVRK